MQRQLIDQCRVIFSVVTLIASFMCGSVTVLIRWRSTFLAQVGSSEAPAPRMHLAFGRLSELQLLIGCELFVVLAVSMIVFLQRWNVLGGSEFDQRDAA